MSDVTETSGGGMRIDTPRPHALHPRDANRTSQDLCDESLRAGQAIAEAVCARTSSPAGRIILTAMILAHAMRHATGLEAAVLNASAGHRLRRKNKQVYPPTTSKIASAASCRALLDEGGRLSGCVWTFGCAPRRRSTPCSFAEGTRWARDGPSEA